jgi:N-methylhydantoinase A
VELVNLRVAAIGRVIRPKMGSMAFAKSKFTASSRAVYFDDVKYDCPVFDRARLPANWQAAGPAIIEEFGSTTVLTPGWEARVDTMGNLRLQPQAGQ